MTEHVLIAGAGIGGLTAALTLHARCIASPSSSGRTCGPSAWESICCHTPCVNSTLSALAPIWPISAWPRCHLVLRHAGALLFREPRGIDGGYGYPQCSVHRGRLQCCCSSTAVPNASVPRLSCTAAALTGFTERTRGRRYRSRRSHRRRSRRSRRRPLVGPLAAASRTRPSAVVGGADVPRRGAGDPFLDGRTMAIVKGAHGVDLVSYPIGDGLVNWVLMCLTQPPGPLPGHAGWNEPADPLEVCATSRTGISAGWMPPTGAPYRAGLRIPDGRPRRAALGGAAR